LIKLIEPIYLPNSNPCGPASTMNTFLGPNLYLIVFINGNWVRDLKNTI